VLLSFILSRSYCQCLSLSLSLSQPSLPGAFWVGMELRGGCFGLGLTDIRESKSTNEAPSPRKDTGFLVSSAGFVEVSPIDRKIHLTVTRQLRDPIDFHSIFFLLWKSMGSINCLVTDILQNILLCAFRGQLWDVCIYNLACGLLNSFFLFSLGAGEADTEGWVVSSESCSFQSIGAKYVHIILKEAPCLIWFLLLV